jgi:hypothetical protein
VQQHRPQARRIAQQAREVPAVELQRSVFTRPVSSARRQAGALLWPCSSLRPLTVK